MSSESYRASIQSRDSFNIEAELVRRNEFSRREVGLNHPDNHSFIRLNDDGDIEIFAAPGVGIVISATSRSISLFGDSVRIFSKENGLRWNNYIFNYSAHDYSQPTLIKIDYRSINSPQNHAQYYLEKLNEIRQEDRAKSITIQGERGFGVQTQTQADSIDYSSRISTEGLTAEQVALIENVLKEYPQEYVVNFVQLLKQGYTFSQAQQKMEEKNSA